jgi:hypothetical protein
LLVELDCRAVTDKIEHADMTASEEYFIIYRRRHEPRVFNVVVSIPLPGVKLISS